MYNGGELTSASEANDDFGESQDDFASPLRLGVLQSLNENLHRFFVGSPDHPTQLLVHGAETRHSG